MRDQDPEWLKKDYKFKRRLQSIYGVIVSLAGFTLLFTLPGAVWLRHVTGWLVILLGGMMVNKDVVLEYLEALGGKIPFLGGNSER